MPIEVIDKIKQKNGAKFKLMDAEDIAIDDTDVKNKFKQVMLRLSQNMQNQGFNTFFKNGEVKNCNYSQMNKIDFKLRDLSEFDSNKNIKVHYCELRAIENNQVATCTRIINEKSFSLSATLYWDKTQGSNFIGFINDDYTFKVGFNPRGFVKWDGSEEILLNNDLESGLYRITITVMSSVIIVSINKTNSTKVKTFIYSHTFSNNNITLCFECYYANDSIRDIKSISINNVNFCPNIIFQAKNQHYGLEFKDINSVPIFVHVPASYNPSIKNKTCIFFHGAGGKGNDFWIYENENKMLKPLLDNGYVVISTNYRNATCWGNDEGMEDIKNLINYFKEILNLSDEFDVVCESMGGMVAFNAMLRNIFNPRRIWGIYPCVNLKKAYEHRDLKGQIQNAYNIQNDDEFEEKTKNHDVLNDYDLKQFKNIPMMLTSSYDDTVVPREFNSDKLKEKIENLGGCVKIVDTTGEHGDQSNFIYFEKTIDFFNSIIAN
ncbi:alpha/beta hydrolase family protein [Clostridium perfringens]|uniref:alpha/beta hydrolase family protein n=1 Tax=Clostridium perfringens TaxID=1502 RepID=UPI0023400885|nr:alpha/beta fold hydrolase [Clostridium perfringens]MDC4245491.1 alpha/beta hydrolase [Clostridium perfringens]